MISFSLVACIAIVIVTSLCYVRCRQQRQRQQTNEAPWVEMEELPEAREARTTSVGTQTLVAFPLQTCMYANIYFFSAQFEYVYIPSYPGYANASEHYYS